MDIRISLSSRVNRPILYAHRKNTLAKYAHALDLSAKIRMREIVLVTRKMASHIAETSGSLKVAF